MNHQSRIQYLVLLLILLSINLMSILLLRIDKPGEHISEIGQLQWDKGSVETDIPFRFYQYQIDETATWSAKIPLNPQKYTYPALLLERPLYFVDMSWNNEEIYKSNRHLGQSAILLPLPKVQEQNLLRLDVQGFIQEGGIADDLRVGEFDEFQRYLHKRSMLATFLFSILFFLMVFNGIAGILDVHHGIYFACAAFFAGQSMVLFSNAEIWYWFGMAIEWQVRIKTFGLFLSLGTALLVGHYFVPLPKVVFNLARSFAVASCLILFLSLDLLQYLRWIGYIFALPMMAWSIVNYWQVEYKRREQYWLAVLISVLVSGGLCDVGSLFDLWSLPPCFPVSATFFAIGLTILVNLRYKFLADQYVSYSDNTEEGLIVLWEDAMIIECNPASQKQFQIQPNQNILDTLPISHMFVQENPVAQMEFSLEQEQFVQHYEAIAIPLYTGRILLHIRNVTAAKEADKHLLQTSKVQLLQQFTGLLAHQFNNALFGIQGYIPYLKQHANHQKIEHFESNLHACTHLVQKILYFTEDQGDSQSTHFINEFLEEIVLMAQKVLSDEIQIQVHVPQSCQVSISYSRMEQLFLSLFNNAQQAFIKSAESKSLGSQTTVQNKQIWIDVHCTEQECRIVIEDSGPGIDASIQEHIFQPFFSTGPQEYLGIGLTVAKKIAEQHQGSLQLVTSKHGDGAAFELRLPIVEEISETTPMQAQSNIFVLEDDPLILEMLVEFLQNQGWTVTTAQSLEEAYENFQIHTMDFLISDVMLPDGNGLDFVRWVVAQEPDIPVLIVSGYIPEYEDQIAQQWAVLQKPFSFVKLQKVLSEFHQN